MAVGDISGRVGWRLAQAVRGKSATEQPKEGTCTVVSRDGEGTVWVRLPGNDFDTPANGGTLASVSAGDSVRYRIEGGRLSILGNGSDPSAGSSKVLVIERTANEVTERFNQLYAVALTAESAVVRTLEAETAKIRELTAEQLRAATAYIQTLVAGNVTASSLVADVAKVHDLAADRLSAAVAYIQALTAGNVTAQNIVADHGDFDTVKANAAKVANLTAQELEADHATVASLDANYAHITEGVIDNATIDVADVNDLDANYAHISNGVIDNASIGYADVDDLDANYAHISDGVIDNASISYADVDDLNAHYAHVNNGVIDNAKIGYADVNNLNAHYAQIDMANVNNGWITNGVIKDAAIESEMVHSVSANKLTAGTINAAEIDVTNLHASSLIVDKLNGQPVIGGYTYVNKNSSGYASKNPKQQGWYELTSEGFVKTSDTTVDATKAYYMDGEATELYDREYIDNLETGLSERIDGAIETFTADAVPTLNNYPAADWLTDKVRGQHVGDICYVTNAGSDYDGYTYRFAYDKTSATYKWVLIKDNQVTAALGRITDLESFESETTSWIEETDEGLTTIRTNHTNLAGVVDLTVTASTQLWFTKANTTAPSAPANDTTTPVTNNSPTGSNSYNKWNLAVPAYNASYPNYYYCWQYALSNGKYRYSAVVRDIAMGESQATSRDAQGKANSNIKSSVQLWYTSNSTTPPAKPYADGSTSSVTSTSTGANQWTKVVPTYASATPRYHYCYQQQRGDGTYQWTDPVYDDATTTAMAKAQASLPSSTFTTFQSTTFKELVDEVDEQSSTITQLSDSLSSVGNILEGTVANPSNWIVSAPSGASYTKEAYGTAGVKVTFNSVGGFEWLYSQPISVTSGNKYMVFFDYTVGKEYTGMSSKSGYGLVAYSGSNAPSGSYDDGNARFLGKAEFPKTASGDRVLKGSFTFTATSDSIILGLNGGHIADNQTGLSFTIDNLVVGETLSTTSTTVNQVKQTATDNSARIGNLTTTLGINADGTQSSTAKYKYNQLDQTLDHTINRVGATESSLKTVSNPNLSPFFSMDLDDVYNSAKMGTDGYWHGSKVGACTKLSDGWTHLKYNNTSTNTWWLTVYEHSAWRHAHGDLKGNTTYTVLMEFRNVTKSGNVTAVGITQHATSWPSMFANGLASQAIEEGASLYFTDTTVADPASVTGNTCTTRTLVTVPAGASIECDLRVSLYEGEYDGPYKPYVDQSLIERVSTAETSIEQTESNVLIQATKSDTTAAQGGQHLIQSLINVAPDGITIDADKVNIEGAAIFTGSGRLSSTSLNNAYDSKGSASAVQSNLDNLQVGGRNLLRETPTAYSKNAYLVYNIPTTIALNELEVGDTITMQLWGVDLDANTSGLRFYWGGGSIDLCASTMPDANGYWKATYELTSTDRSHAHAANKFVHIYNFVNGHSGASLSIERWKIERGNKCTDWSPSPEDVDDSISAVQVGGRNLLKCSKVSSENLAKTLSSSTSYTSLVTEDGYDCYKVTGASTQGMFYGTNKSATDVAVALDANTTYIYSAWIKATTTASGVTYLDHHFSSLGHHQVYNTASTASDKSHEDVVAKRVYFPERVNIGEWTHITEQFTTNSLAGSYFGKYVKHALGDAYTVYVRDMKLEKGTRATDWTPAPEDVDASIATAQSTANANVRRTQRIYYRKATSGAPGVPSAWVENGNVQSSWTKYNAWSTRVPPIADSTAANPTKYPYLYTCEQSQTAGSTTLQYTTVLLDDSTTIIDGGNIITGSIAANTIKATVIDAVNSGEGLIKADKINVSQISIGDLSGSIGGRNLLRNTGSYGTWDPSAAGASAYITSTDEYVKFTPPSSKSWWTIEPHAACIPLDEWDTSGTYVISIDVKLDNRKNAITYPSIAVAAVANANAGYSSRVRSMNRNITPTLDGWTHYAYRFDGDYSEWSSNSDLTPAYIKTYIWLYLDSSDVDAVYIRNLKLEKGSRATDWTPAPEDQIAYVDESIDGISIGGRNLYKSTTTALKAGTGAATISAHDDAYHGRTVTVTSASPVMRLCNIIPETNVPYTISFTCTASAACTIQIDVMDNVVQGFNVPAGTSRVVCTSMPTRAVDSTYHFIDILFNTVGTYKLADIMVEQSTKASSWSPAPEDVDSSITKAQTTANSAIKRSQRIYYRSSTDQAPTTMPTAWVTESGNKWAANRTTATNWTTKVTPISNGTGASVTKYLYLWTCLQYQLADGSAPQYTAVLLDDSTTVIDGGKIITGSLQANAVSATSGTFAAANIPNLDASKINAGDIAAARIKANVISAINSLTAGKIDADRINVGEISIGSLSGSIGGRNLIRGTGDWSTYSKSANGTYAIDGTKDGCAVLKVTTTSTTSTDTTFSSKFTVDIEADAYYTLSFWAKASTAVSCWCFWYSPNAVDSAVNQDGATSTRADGGITNAITTSWKRYSVTWHIKSDATSFPGNVIPVRLQTAASVWIAGCKFEKGNRATDWTPAPEDVSQMVKIDTASRSFTTAQWKTYGAVGHSENWTTGTSYDNSKIRVGDTAYLTGTVSDGVKGTATIIGTVTAVNGANGSTSITMSSTQLIFGGDSVDAAAKTATTYLTDGGSNGLMVHPSNDANTGVQITSDVDIVRAGTSVAKYGDTARIGKEAGARVTIAPSGIDLYGSSDGSVNLAHFGYASGNAESGTSTKPFFTLGTRKSGSAIGNYSTVIGNDCTASKWNSYAEGHDTTASGNTSHAEGDGSTASANNAHAEGSGTTASGASSHAEGMGTVASGTGAHAQNIGTIASANGSTAIGAFNEPGNYILMVGNGEGESNRSNALTVDPNGNLVIAGGITLGTALTAAQIPSLAASKITSGTFAADRIPSLAAGKITSGTFAVARIPSLSTSQITSGTFNAARIPVVANLNGIHVGKKSLTFNNAQHAQLLTKAEAEGLMGYTVTGSNAVVSVCSGDSAQYMGTMTAELNADGIIRVSLDRAFTGTVTVNYQITMFQIG